MKLDGCEGWTPRDLPAPEPPTLGDVLSGAPADFVTDFEGQGVHGRIGAVEGVVPQMTDVTGAVGADVAFDGATPFRPDAGERVWIVFRATADADAGSNFGRNVEFTVQLGDATFDVRPGKGRFETHVSAPGVSLREGDAIRYDVAGGGALASEVGLEFETSWNGEFPIVLGDARNGLEVRALRGEAWRKLIERHLAALDDATLASCREAVLEPEVVPSWHLRKAREPESHYENVAAVAGWNDPRLLARVERRDRIMAAWRTELAAYHAEALGRAVPVGDPIHLSDGELRVTRALACKPEDPSRRLCPYECEAVLELVGGDAKDARENAKEPILFASGLAFVSYGFPGDETGNTMTLTTCDTVAPDPDGAVLYRPRWGDAWMRLR